MPVDIAGEEQTMELKGYSGCQLSIREWKGQQAVFKVSSSPDYDRRLKKQKEKQERLCLKGFGQCRVLGEGEEGGRYFFIMEYINGATLAEEMQCFPISGIKPFIDSYMENAKPFTRKNEKAGHLFRNKIKSLSKAIGKPTGESAKALELVAAYDWGYVIDSECHGDLTLQNILVQDGRMYLIDCLDSFCDSWMVDAAKLLQDAELLWSYRGQEPSNNLVVRLTAMRDLLVDSIRKMEEGEELVRTIYHILILNLLRIAPYTRDRETGSFLREKIAYVAREIEREGWR